MGSEIKSTFHQNFTKKNFSTGEFDSILRFSRASIALHECSEGLLEMTASSRNLERTYLRLFCGKKILKREIETSHKTSNQPLDNL